MWFRVTEIQRWGSRAWGSGEHRKEGDRVHGDLKIRRKLYLLLFYRWKSGQRTGEELCRCLPDPHFLFTPPTSLHTHSLTHTLTLTLPHTYTHSYPPTPTPASFVTARRCHRNLYCPSGDRGRRIGSFKTILVYIELEASLCSMRTREEEGEASDLKNTSYFRRCGPGRWWALSTSFQNCSQHTKHVPQSQQYSRKAGEGPWGGKNGPALYPCS